MKIVSRLVWLEKGLPRTVNSPEVGNIDQIFKLLQFQYGKSTGRLKTGNNQRGMPWFH